MCVSGANKNAVAKLNILFRDRVHYCDLSEMPISETAFTAFSVAVSVDGRHYIGVGKTKKAARNAAAERALISKRLWTDEDEEVKLAAMVEVDEDPVEAVHRMQDAIAQEREMQSWKQQAGWNEYPPLYHDAPRGGMARGRGRWNMAGPGWGDDFAEWGDDECWDRGDSWEDPFQGDPGNRWEGPFHGSRGDGWDGPFQGDPSNRWEGPFHGSRDDEWDGPFQGDPGNRWDGPFQGDPRDRREGPFRGKRGDRWDRPVWGGHRDTWDGPFQGDRDDRWDGPFQGDRDDRWDGPFPGDRGGQSNRGPRGRGRSQPIASSFNDQRGRPEAIRGRGFRGAGGGSTSETFHRNTDSSSTSNLDSSGKDDWNRSVPVARGRGGSGTARNEKPSFPQSLTPKVTPPSSEFCSKSAASIPAAPAPQYPSIPNPPPPPPVSLSSFAIDPATGMYYPSVNQTNQGSVPSTTQAQAQYMPTGMNYYMGGMPYQNMASNMTFPGNSATGYVAPGSQAQTAIQTNTMPSYASYAGTGYGSVYGQGDYSSY